MVWCQLGSYKKPLVLVPWVPPGRRRIWNAIRRSVFRAICGRIRTWVHKQDDFWEQADFLTSYRTSWSFWVDLLFELGFDQAMFWKLQSHCCPVDWPPESAPDPASDSDPGSIHGTRGSFFCSKCWHSILSIFMDFFTKVLSVFFFRNNCSSPFVHPRLWNIVLKLFGLCEVQQVFTRMHRRWALATGLDHPWRATVCEKRLRWWTSPKDYFISFLKMKLMALLFFKAILIGELDSHE